MFFIAFFTIGCVNNSKAVAMNEYHPSIQSSTQIAIVTPQKIKEIQKRKATFLQKNKNLP